MNQELDFSGLPLPLGYRSEKEFFADSHQNQIKALSSCLDAIERLISDQPLMLKNEGLEDRLMKNHRLYAIMQSTIIRHDKKTD